MRLNNQQYRKAHGPLLSLKAAKYYKLFGDAIPSKWEHHMQNQDNSINMQVWFGGDERTAPLRGNIISPSQVCISSIYLNVLRVVKSKAAPNVRFFSDSSSEKLFSLVMLDAGK